MRLGGWLQSIPLYIPRRNKLRAILRAQDRSEGAKDEQELLGDDVMLNAQHVAHGNEDPVPSVITALVRYRELKCQQVQDPRRQNGFICGAAAKAAAELSYSQSGPESAERLLIALLDQGILPHAECGPVIGAVLGGFNRKKDAHRVIHAARTFFAGGKVVPSPRSLVSILRSCESLGSQDLLHQAWNSMVVPALKVRRLPHVPRAVSSSYLRACFMLDLEEQSGKGLEDCLKFEGNVTRGIQSIWALEGQKLVGPLLTTIDIMALSQQAKYPADLDLLLNSSLGRHREDKKETILGYRPNISPLDIVWEGELSGTRAWGAPLASKIISKSIKLGLNQFAMEIVAASIAEGRTYMVSMQPLNPAMSQDVKLLFSLNYTLHMLWKVLKSSPPVWEEITTHADSDKQPVNALLNAASLSGNTQMAVSAAEILHQHSAAPRSRPGRSFLRLLAETPPPWGYKGNVSSEIELKLGKNSSELSASDWICMIDCVMRAGGSLQQIITLVDSALSHKNSRLQSSEDNSGAVGRAKILGAAMQALSGRVGYEEKKKYIKFFLQVGTKVIGNGLSGKRRDHMVSRALASLKDSRVDHALTKGQMRSILQICIQMHCFPGRKSISTLLHMCILANAQSKASFPISGGPCMDAAGINLNDALSSIERSKGVSRQKAAELLAPELRQIVLKQGFSAVEEIATGKVSDLIKVVVDNHVQLLR